MGEIADSMIEGELCHYCGVDLEPKEKVYLVQHEKGVKRKVFMPEDGSSFGVPVLCYDCMETSN